MRTALRIVVVVAMALGARQALACHLDGKVICYGTEAPVEGARIVVGGVGEALTDGSGGYLVYLPGYGTYTASLDLSGLPGSWEVISPGASVTFTGEFVTQDWVIDGPACHQAACWLTGGGAKFSTLTGTTMAEHGPQVSMGGNVNPGCSPIAGDGGQWNHVDHGNKLFFHGDAIVVDDCGPIFEGGSDSPDTPYNYIEFHGTGTLKGLPGSKFGTKTDVCFTGRAEDRNEPGSSGQRDGAYKDRYFISITDCAGFEYLSLEDEAGGPITITDGNLQIHVSSCTE